jgi:hypothetical protein
MRARDCCMRECRWMCNYYIGGGGRCGLASVHGCTLACMYALLHAGCRTGGLVRTCVCRISKCITRISQCISRAGHAMVPPALSRCGCDLGDSTRRPGPGEFGPLPAPAGPGQHAAANSAATSNGTVPPFQLRHRASLSRVGAAAFRVHTMSLSLRTATQRAPAREYGARRGRFAHQTAAR